MNEVKRYELEIKDDQIYRVVVPKPFGQVVGAKDFDRVVAERDALQQRLSTVDQRLDELEGLLQDARRYVESAWPDGVHSYRKNSLSGDLLGQIDAALNPTYGSCPAGCIGAKP